MRRVFTLCLSLVLCGCAQPTTPRPEPCCPDLAHIMPITHRLSDVRPVKRLQNALHSYSQAPIDIIAIERIDMYSQVTLTAGRKHFGALMLDGIVVNIWEEPKP